MMKKYEERSAAKVKITGEITKHKIEVPGCWEGGIQVIKWRHSEGEQHTKWKW